MEEFCTVVLIILSGFMIGAGVMAGFIEHKIKKGQTQYIDDREYHCVENKGGGK